MIDARLLALSVLQRGELHRMSMRTHTKILGKFKEQFKTGAQATVQQWHWETKGKHIISDYVSNHHVS